MEYIVYIKNRNIIDCGCICNDFEQALQLYIEYLDNLKFLAEQHDFAIVDNNKIIDTYTDEVVYKIELKQITKL